MMSVTAVQTGAGTVSSGSLEGSMTHLHVESGGHRLKEYGTCVWLKLFKLQSDVEISTFGIQTVKCILLCWAVQRKEVKGRRAPRPSGHCRVGTSACSITHDRQCCRLSWRQHVSLLLQTGAEIVLPLAQPATGAGSGQSRGLARAAGEFRTGTKIKREN
ncbi:unnamed protein product [Protopolystoma xenopodis]|uniref:Uncharacterized protein n=1 Tax=Protopolystoma xenopodis TaxID=117903 RepID=A0A3S5A0Y9_9PLAT|nr:unnamed protein product [Protopolystoma xenopodis]